MPPGKISMFTKIWSGPFDLKRGWRGKSGEETIFLIPWSLQGLYNDKARAKQ